MDYAFVLEEDGPERPDPRSPFQPRGVHGPSRVVDPGAFRWTAPPLSAPPLAEAVFYELHVGTFSRAGTFDGAIDHLDHLARLGVTHVEVMPVAEFPGRRGWGYDGVDLFAPHHAYGGPEGFVRLVDACHARGLAVVLDVVYNHLGPAGNYLGEFGPYFSERHHTPWGSAVNLDGPGSDEVRRFFADNALLWLRDYRVDALRLDAVHALFDQSAVHFLEQLAGEVRALEAEVGRRLALVAESDLNDPRVVRAAAEGGYGIDAQWSDDYHHAVHALATGERDGYYQGFGTLAHVAKALERVFVYDGQYDPHRDRRHGRPVGDVPRHRFLAYLQNHDQTGNRARGDRLSTLVAEGPLAAAAALTLLAPFVPLLFQGEEWGSRVPFQYFTDHEDEGLGKAVTEGRRREFASFGWRPEDVPDPQDAATFERSRLDWSERERAPHARLLEWHRALIALRARIPRDALPAVRTDEEARWLVMTRGPYTLVCNFADGPRSVPAGDGSAEVVLASTEVARDGGALTLGPGAAVLGPM
jgi:maltooligosyltrehalose trehalohydrolase